MQLSRTYRFCILLLIGWAASASAQELLMDTIHSPWSWGGFVHGGLNLHQASFQQLPSIPNCCSGYENGSGSGYSLGAVLQYQLDLQLFLEGRLSYQNQSAELQVSEPTFIEVDGKVTNATLDHDLKAKLGVMMIEPAVKFYF